MPLIPLEIAQQYQVIAMKEDTFLHLTSSKSLPSTDLLHLEKILHKKVKLHVDYKFQIAPRIDALYCMTATNDQLGKELLESLSNESIEPLFRFIFQNCLKILASDIHFLLEEDCKIQFRIDGQLRTFTVISREKGEGLIRYVKIQSKIKMSNTVQPVEGRFSVQDQEDHLDIRVSILPTVRGQKMSLRILGFHQHLFSMEEIGFEPDELRRMKQAISKKSGFVLICGPTGSGKSTTLFSFIQHIHDGHKSIHSIEDPVEYYIPGIAQTNVNQQVGLDFAHLLVSILRQDPDVVYLGEIRDQISADTAIKAAMTGHLVFTTLHTKTIQGAIERLLDFQIDPSIIRDSISFIVNQRLVRKLCPHCKEKIKTPLNQSLSIDTPYIYEARGCHHCYGTGYNGRIAVYEMVENISFLLEPARPFEVHPSIGSRLQRLVESGVTSLEEAYRYIV